jgi:hypothetical protein
MERIDDLRWRKSSFSGNGGGSCVEVASGAASIHVRDTKSRERGFITVTSATWQTFMDEIKAGRAGLSRLRETEISPGASASMPGLIYIPR